MKKYIFDNSIKGKHKVFDQGLCDKFDKPAREKIKNILGDFVIDNPNIYAQDLVINDPTYKYKYLELQVCANWIENYPYEKVFIYERKFHYDIDTLFITLNKDLSKGFVFDAQSFKLSKPHRFKKYAREFVYDVPWNRIMQVCLDDFDIQTLKLY